MNWLSDHINLLSKIISFFYRYHSNDEPNLNEPTKMANITIFILLILTEIGLSTEDENKQDTEINNLDLDDYIEYNKTDIYDIYNNTNEEANKPVNHKKCEVINATNSDDADYIQTNTLNSIYLNNMHSSLTSNLIEVKLSVDGMELEGVNLFDIVSSDCGGAKVCPNANGYWTDNKTITVGFLGAYGRSQVSALLYFKKRKRGREKEGGGGERKTGKWKPIKFHLPDVSFLPAAYDKIETTNDVLGLMPTLPTLRIC